MSTRDRANEIAEIKQREDRGHGRLSWTLKDLQKHWSKTNTSAASTPDFYVIRTVTLLEVFTRRNIAALIDQGDRYVERAVELSKHFKIDLALVRAVHGRTITIGDIVAHNVPLNSFGQIIGYFDTLFGKPVRPLLETAVDRWAIEIGKKIATVIRPVGEVALGELADDLEKMAVGPIVGDFDAIAARLSRLFDLRHILCHEVPTKPIYEVSEIEGFLDAAVRFARAAEEVLTFERFGLVPLTQTDMNIAADERLRNAETELSNIILQIQTRMSADSDWLHSLDDAQQKWLAYRNAQCDFDTYLHRGGSIRPTLWAAEATRLTEARSVELGAWLKRGP